MENVIEIIRAAAIIGGSILSATGIIYFGMRYYFRKTKPKDVIRNISLELPDSWFSHLAKIIKKNAGTVHSNQGFSNIYVWKNEKYTLTYKEQFNTNDVAENIENYDLPKIVTAIIIIERNKRLINSQISYMSLDRTFSRDELSVSRFRDAYESKLKLTPHVYVRGRRAL